VEDDPPGGLVRAVRADVVDVREQAEAGELLRVAPEMLEARIPLVLTALAAASFAPERGVVEDAVRVVAALVAPDSELTNVHLTRRSRAGRPGRRIHRASSAGHAQRHDAESGHECGRRARGSSTFSVSPTRRDTASSSLRSLAERVSHAAARGRRR